MKLGKQLGLITLLLFLCKVAFAQTIPVGDVTNIGIVLVTETVKTQVYEIKLKALSTADRAHALDAAMLSKQGILTCSTNVATRICRVEVLRSVTTRNLREVVGAVGLEVAKTFTE